MAGYDIFISYRRKTGAQYARILQLMLQQRGYKVFLDYDELKDGAFGKHIQRAIKEAPVFMLVLSEDSLNRCFDEKDWVRREILLAMEHNKHIIPVNPDKSFNGIPEDKPSEVLPESLRRAVTDNQHSDIDFGQTLGVTIDFMVSNRLVSTLGVRSCQAKVDTDLLSAQQSLRIIDAHNRFIKRLVITGVSIALLLISLTCFCVLRHLKIQQEDRKRQEKLVYLEQKHAGFKLRFSSVASIAQMDIIDAILMNMKEVCKDSLWISKYEFTMGEWYGILGMPYDDGNKFYPITNVSYGEIRLFLDTLRSLSGLDVEKTYKFDLPTAHEWEYAARGGVNNDSTLYAGRANIDDVAWYAGNSGGVVHMSDGLQRKNPNSLDLYDMSGNVGEICNTIFEIMDEGARLTVCGGNFKSSADQVTVVSRMPYDVNAKDETIGFRLVVRCE